MSTVLALLIFVASYVLIMTEKLNRALVAIAGGVLLLMTKVYEWEQAFGFIDWETVALLFSMMVLVSITKKTGIFTFMAIWLAQLVKGRPVPLLIVTALFTAVGSAFLDNVTTVLLFVPVLLSLVERLKLPAFPYLILTIFSSNIGGTATLIGDPPNIMIGQAVDHFSFVSFLYHLGPVVVIIFFLVTTGVILLFRKGLTYDKELAENLMKMDAKEHLKITPLLIQSISVMLLTILGFMMHPIVHMDITTIAVSGALLLLFLSEKELDVEHVFQEVEWVTLFFFMGLFMLVGGLETVGIIDELARGMVWISGGDMPVTSMVMLWSAGILSGIVDNIPFVAAMIPVVQELQGYGMMNVDPVWWSLALGACLGGNGTLVGASANVVVAGLAASHNKPIPFLKFSLYGFPVLILSLIIATIYVWLRYLLPFLS
ncbi:Na+/H+ antiporter NhaD [Halobacillus karajensis]|uniref:Arsenical pump membrane protein n=1 Tax=Halobacillus karajensis TaxID=195088 RepID=A0A024P5X1_9BACI|nr:ArsB/NhaD family transporter [Halobacillus karajensis]CDQ18113.1 arsenical pump membrane protein [Halobacillus karajensis]CDQ24464.1 arsenical pump membrane protein [Halobacillus karajensis]CDQ29288.1 arsenical pump membrane protein [Halobacillus karajensis]SEH59019.1 Na+/H+ antiporter NhaD [Halobacillus karajensis]